MEKNEVYDYLAKVYLDKQPPAKSKKEAPNKKYLWLFLILSTIVLAATVIYKAHPRKFFKVNTYSLSLSTGNELIKIKYNFDNSTTKKEGYTITLSHLNADNFEALEFQGRALSKKNLPKLRVELENDIKETASYYLKALDNKWKNFRIALEDFKGITQWNSLKRISFIVEEWNVENKNDSIYIDEIRLVKKKREG